MDDADEHTMDEDTLVLSKPLSDLRMLVLQRELARRGLPMDGRKHELVDRLQSALDAEDAGERGPPTDLAWEIASTSDGVVPFARAGHGLVAFCNRLYLFGGFSDALQDRYLETYPLAQEPTLRLPTITGPHYNSVYEYSFDTKAWKELHPGANDHHMVTIPKPRRHASLVVHGCSLFVYGGFDSSDNVLNDMWEFNIQRSTWSKVQYRLAHNNEQPLGRAEHTAVVYLNRMFVFGGYDGKRKLNDTYVFDFATRTWSCPPLAVHNAPSRRCKHTAVLYNKNMYVLGGFQFNNGDNYALTDMHALDLHTFVWRSILMSQGCPQALQGHKAVVADDSMYVVGGKVRTNSIPIAHGETRSTGLNPAVFCYNFERYRWSVVQVDGYTPAPRQLHAAVAVPKVGGKTSIFLFGGTDKAKQLYYDDLCELRHREVTMDTQCAGCSSTGRLLNNKQFSDVHFIVQGQTVYAHRAILYSRSDYFRTMFDAQMRESSELMIPIPDVSHDVFLAVMEYLYTRKANVRKGQLAVELLKAADMFRLDGLRSYCVIKVEQAITVENVCDIVYIADTHNTESLKQFCLNFIVQNFKPVIFTDSWLHLMNEDAAGLGREILAAVADANPHVAASHKRARK